MNWEAIGAIGDAVGGIGVVLSLIYLAIQTKSNTRAVQSASFHQANEAFANMAMLIALDPALVVIMDKASKGQTLPEDEQTRFHWVLMSLFRRAESTYFQTELGTLQSNSWAGIELTLKLAISSPLGAVWWATSSPRFNPQFRAYVESNLIAERPNAA